MHTSNNLNEYHIFTKTLFKTYFYTKSYQPGQLNTTLPQQPDQLNYQNYPTERPGSSLSMHATSFSVLFIMVLMLSSSLEIFSQIANSPLQNNTIRLSRFKFKSTSSQNSTNAYSKKQQTVSDINEISSKLTIPLLNRKQKTRSQSKKHKTTKKTIDNKDLIGLFKKTFMSLVGSNEILVSKYSESKVPAYIMDLYKQSDTKHTWRAANRRIKNGWFAGDTIRSFMPDTQRSNDDGWMNG